MRITVTIGGVEHECVQPYATAQYVEVLGRPACPHCAGWPALIGGEPRAVLALARSDDGLRAARRTYPQAQVQLPAERPAWMLPTTGEQYLLAPNALHVRLPHPKEEHDRYTGDATCTRCGQVVGPMQVLISTIFGIEEDRRVLEGRCRVY